MPVSSVTQVFSAYAHQVTGATGQASATSTAAAAREEANETVAQTKQEAAKGDRAAKAKLAREQQKQQLQNGGTAALSAPGIGSLVNLAA